jgi:hypothetical protein
MPRALSQTQNRRGEKSRSCFKEEEQMSFSFKGQLRTGQIGEVLFHLAHAGTLTRTDGRKADFLCALTGDGTELKTDSYDMEKTPFFFMERFSDAEKRSPGGPWQAASHGAKYFAYFFVTNLTFFRFETEKLVAKLDELLPSLTPVPISNKSWTTVGYKVPRAALEGLYERVALNVTISA